MAHVARSIELNESADAVYDHWTRFEALPRCEVPEIESGVRWRAEVLTVEPRGSRTRVTLRIEYNPSQPVHGLARRVEAALESFRSFVEERAVAHRRAVHG